RANRAIEVRALDPALESEDEDEAPDHDRGAEDEDAGLAKRLAEELEHPPRVDEAHRAPAKASDLSHAREPISRNCQPAGHYLMTEISGWVASRVWVKT